MAFFCLSLVVFVILLTQYTTDTYVYVSGTYVDFTSEVWWKQLMRDIYRFVIGVLGCIVVIIMSYYILIKKMTFISKFGKLSMGIYIISGYLNIYMLIMITKAFNPSLWVVAIETLLMLLVCSYLTIIITKIPVFNILLLGGRKIKN